MKVIVEMINGVDKMKEVNISQVGSSEMKEEIKREERKKRGEDKERREVKERERKLEEEERKRKVLEMARSVLFVAMVAERILDLHLE